MDNSEGKKKKKRPGSFYRNEATKKNIEKVRSFSFMKGWLQKDEDVANNGSEAVGTTLDRDFDVCVGVTIDQDDVANNESGALEATMDQDNGTSIDMTLDLVDDGSVHEAEERLMSMTQSESR
ncbi:hypothetical protein JTE90_018618 [Oedothorax gibbosus]|uniref:Zinc finger protein n=1 Tax=Oedothorax gibbosus TaxID=931172 RepID=A0AAV6UMD8_9ARAC|nr:hypothetical protein JTE90_018618 [Oedothorax gibbosus]